MKTVKEHCTTKNHGIVDEFYAVNEHCTVQEKFPDTVTNTLKEQCNVKDYCIHFVNISSW